MTNSWPVWTDRLKNHHDQIKPCIALSSRTAVSTFKEGGLRLQGIQKSGIPGTPLITYITVVRNHEKTLSRTIESVQNQSYKNIEHIVIDGASTDATFEVIQKYANCLDYFASEPDEGLYDALNKAIPLAKGDLICILNSDDWLTEKAAETVAHAFSGAKNELILGSALVRKNHELINEWLPKTISMNSYFAIPNCCHNAIYATKNVYELSGPYDKYFKIAGDFKWLMTCLEAKVFFNYNYEFLINYSLGGLSSDIIKYLSECQMIIKDRFEFLTDEEVEILTYIYNPLRSYFNHEKYKKYHWKKIHQNLMLKYQSDIEFIAAINAPLPRWLKKENKFNRYLKNQLKALIRWLG